MDEDGQEDDYSSLDSNESLAVDQSSSLQVEKAWPLGAD
jgi:hypothetical protein